MLTEFKSFIQKKSLCTQTDRILVAVSGGADSVVLLHLFIKAGYIVSLAHCNFNLRGIESDGDEAFVRKICDSYNIEGHFISFNTREYAAENKISIEMAARNLRYHWFNELVTNHNYTKIATGHHLNDSIETVFINVTRGTGINGITGIKAKNEVIIRPLLFATRNEMLQMNLCEILSGMKLFLRLSALILRLKLLCNKIWNIFVIRLPFSTNKLK
jgi:tRNA(Ile)-lysidine synthase